MRVLILSADVGKTYRSVVTAVTEQLTKADVAFDTVDALIMIPAKGDALARWGKSKSYRRLSMLMGRAYTYEEGYVSRLFYKECARGADALQSVLEKERYDAVLCLHVYACMMMTEVRKKYGATVPCYFLATDYTVMPGISELRADGFFIPHRMLFGDFVRRGIAADRMVATGIPVRREFYPSEDDRQEARASLQLPDHCRNVLLRAGNMQSSRTYRRVMRLYRALPEDTVLLVLCGNNRKLRKRLSAVPQERLRTFDADAPIRECLAVADVCVGKARGIPVTEAMVRGIPVVLFRELPGSESRSFEFLIRNGVASGSRHWSGVVTSVGELLGSPDAVAERRKTMSAFLPQNAAEQICRILTGQ